MFVIAGVVLLTGLFSFLRTFHPNVQVTSSIAVVETGCRCEVNNMTYDFCYHLPVDPKIVGRRFNCSYGTHLLELGLLSNAAVLNLRSDALPEPAFITAMSENHFREGLTLIANIRKLWPQLKIVVYNLGLSANSVADLKTRCLVELRDFAFAKYPIYVQHLLDYRWKPLLIAEALQEFGAIWYMDTSVRWQTDRREIVYDEIRCRKYNELPDARIFFDSPNVTRQCGKSGYLLHSPSSHSIFAVTHPGVYDYIPTLLEYIKQSSCENQDANFAYIVRTQDAINTLKWLVLCALEENCMAPPGAKLKCEFQTDRFLYYAKCHRYDQSVLNILLANRFGYYAKNYVSKMGTEGVIIQRSASASLTEKDFSCGSKE